MSNNFSCRWRILLNKWFSLESFHLLNPFLPHKQACFRHGRSTADQVTKITHTHWKMDFRINKFLRSSLDLTSAFATQSGTNFYIWSCWNQLAASKCQSISWKYCTNAPLLRLRTKSRIGQNPERTKSRIGQNPDADKIPNWTKSRTDKIPHWTKSKWTKSLMGQNPERTKSKMKKITKGQNLEWKKSRI